MRLTIPVAFIYKNLLNLQISAMLVSVKEGDLYLIYFKFEAFIKSFSNCTDLFFRADGLFRQP